MGWANYYFGEKDVGEEANISGGFLKLWLTVEVANVRLILVYFSGREKISTWWG